MTTRDDGSSAARWRVATPDDDLAVVRMSRALYEEDPSPEPVPEEQTRRTIQALRDEPLRGRAIVLEKGGVCVGFSLLISFWSNELGGETCEVDELYIEPEFRSQGHATDLFRRLAEGTGPWPRAVAAVCLQVTPTNEKARALYERLGFRPIKNTLMALRIARS